MVKTGIVKTENIGLITQPANWLANDWITIKRFGSNYSVIKSFAHYFEGIESQFEKVFDTEEAYKQWELSPWNEPDWRYRILLTNEQLVYITLNYFDMLISMNTEPINPRYEIETGVLVYLDSFTYDAYLLLESMGVNIEEFIN